MSKTMTLSEKLFAIMQNMDVVEKDKFNEFQKYKYASDTNYVNKVRKSLIQYRVRYHVELLSKEYLTVGDKVHVFITGNLVFTDVDTAEEAKIPYMGQGVDNGDKALYKAITGMKKYGINTTFTVATEDDPEADSVSDKIIVSPETEAMIERVASVASMEEYETLKPELGKFSIRLGQYEAEKLKKVCVEKIQSLKQV